MTVSEGNNNDTRTDDRIIEDLDIELGFSENNQHDSELDNWADSIARILKDVPEYMCRRGHPGRISRIPNNLREVDSKAYEPYFLSIGPYHRGEPKLQSMEKTKRLVLKYVLEILPELTSKDYLGEIETIEQEARSFYSDIEMESEEFMQMLLIDSMYILTFFCGIPASRETINPTNARIGTRLEIEDTNRNQNPVAESADSNDDTRSEESRVRLFSVSFHHDLFLLENQIPFFVVRKLHALVYGDSETRLLSIMKNKVADFLLPYAKLNSELVISPSATVHHLLHLCHMFFHPTIQQESTPYRLPESTQMFRLGSAVQLYETGVSFVARSSFAQHSLLDITFSSSGEMIMPSLCVDDNTNSLLRNLIALEQMKYPSMGLDVSAYAVLLLHLVTTPEDAQLLRRKEVIQHHLASDKEMMYLVNKLSVGLSFDYVEDNYSLKPVFQELNRYSENRVPRWKAWLKHRHFNNPWTMISLFAASILLVLSFVETYYAVYSYYHPYFDGHS